MKKIIKNLITFIAGMFIIFVLLLIMSLLDTYIFHTWEIYK